MKNEPHKNFFILVFKIRFIYYCSGKNNVLLIYQHFSEYSKYGSQFQIDFIWLYACKSSNAWLQNLLYYTLFFNDPNLEKKRLHAVDMLIDYNILSPLENISYILLPVNFRPMLGHRLKPRSSILII